MSVQPGISSSRNFSGMRGLLGLTAIVVAYLLAVTYPYRWIVNGASLENGVALFDRGGILQSRDQLLWIDEVIREGALSVELSVRPLLLDQAGPARILTISKDYMIRNLTIGQEGQNLIVRLRRSADTPNGTPPYVIPEVFGSTGRRTIVVSIEQNSLSVRVDNRLRLRRSLPDQALSYWDTDFKLAVGNELVWGRPWLGTIDRAWIKTPSRSVNLLSAATLERPAIDELFQRRFALGTTSVSDALLNLFGFVPIGTLSLWCLSRPRILLVAAIWLVVCLTGEGLQLFVAGRFPSALDLFLNISGALAGAGIGVAVKPPMGRREVDQIPKTKEPGFGRTPSRK